MSFSKWIFVIIIINLCGALAGLIWYQALNLPPSVGIAYEYLPHLDELSFLVYIANMMSGAVGAFIGYVGRQYWIKWFKKINPTDFSVTVSGAVIFFLIYFIVSTYIILSVD